MKNEDQTAREGIHQVSILFGRLGWIVREQATSDYGIDLQAEKRDSDGSASGKLIAIQVKTGSSFFKKRGDGFVFYGEARHQTYWLNHSLPVFIVLHNPETGLTLWQRVLPHLVEQKSQGRWALFIPATNTVDEEHAGLIEAGIPDDQASYRRYKLAVDLPLIQRHAQEPCIYLAVDEWVNKSLNFRRSSFIYSDDVTAPAETALSTYYPARGIEVFMANVFPWLSWKYEAYESDAGGSGEIDEHVLIVELNELGRAVLAVESYFQSGAKEQAAPDWGYDAGIDDIRDED